MREPTEDGKSTVQKHLEGAASRGDRKAAARLKAPELPEVLEYLWHWFAELDRSRGEGFSGPAPVTHEQIRAWAANTYRDPTPDEVDALLRLDTAIRYPPDPE